MAVEVKVCGLRRPEDAAVAIAAGALYLGVVYAGGPRRVDDAGARAIVQAAGERPVLAVWGPPEAGPILRSRDAAGFRGVQLHGGGDVALARALRAEGLLVWRVARIAEAADLAGIEELAAEAHAVLLEPRVAGVPGGAGVPLALELAQAAVERLRRAAPAVPVALAGGLRPESVGAAIRAVRPDIVDVSSGVEISPGVKDPILLRRFLERSLGDHPSP